MNNSKKQYLKEIKTLSRWFWVPLAVLVIIILLLYFLPGWTGWNPEINAIQVSLYYLIIPLITIGIILFLLYSGKRVFQYKIRLLGWEIQQQKQEEENRRTAVQQRNAKKRREIQHLFELITLNKELDEKNQVNMQTLVKKIIDKLEPHEKTEDS